MVDKLEQLGSAHECFSDLLHAIDPLVLIGIVCGAAGIPMPEVVEVRYRNPRIEIAGVTKPAAKKIVDVVFTSANAAGKLDVWILEIELSWDWLKVLRWALYELAFQSEHDARSARLAVFSPEPELRGRIRERIVPRMKTNPVVLEPDHFQRITDYQEARRQPELTILGCLFHAQPPARFEAQVEVFRAAWMAIQSLAENEARRYSVLVMSLVPEAVQDQGIAELRESGELDEYGYELFTESERKGGSFARGHREGVEQGRCETLRRAVLDVLELRGFAVSDATRERVESSESIEQLERWYAAAKTGNQALAQLLAD